MLTDMFFSLRHDTVLPVQTKRLSPCSVWVRSVHLFLKSCVTHELSRSISISQTQCTIYDWTATPFLPIYRTYYMRVWAIRSNFHNEKNQQWNNAFSNRCYCRPPPHSLLRSAWCFIVGNDEVRALNNNLQFTISNYMCSEYIDIQCKEQFFAICYNNVMFKSLYNYLTDVS